MVNPANIAYVTPVAFEHRGEVIVEIVEGYSRPFGQPQITLLIAGPPNVAEAAMALAGCPADSFCQFDDDANDGAGTTLHRCGIECLDAVREWWLHDKDFGNPFDPGSLLGYLAEFDEWPEAESAA